MNNESKKYYRELKTLLPLRGKQEKKLFHDIHSRVSDLSTNTTDLTYEQICEELGSPHEVVSEYFYNSNTEYLAKKLRITVILRRFFVLAIVTCLILISLYAYTLHQALEAVKNDVISYSIEYIE